MDINIADSVRGSSYRQWLLAILGKNQNYISNSFLKEGKSFMVNLSADDDN